MAAKRVSAKPEVIEQWMNAVNNEGSGLSDWELKFMESFTEQWFRSHFISEKQETILERIYSGKTPL